MTPDEVRAIRARADAATPGPWGATEPSVWASMCHDATDGTVSLLGEMGSREDEVFVASARIDVPRLCDEVERLSDLLYLVEVDDEKGLIELGRREERGRVLLLLREKETTLAARLGDTGEGEPPDVFAEFVVRGLIRAVGEAGPSCDPLPAQQAASRIAALEQALRDVIEYGGRPILGEGGLAVARLEKCLHIATLVLGLER